MKYLLAIIVLILAIVAVLISAVVHLPVFLWEFNDKHYIEALKKPLQWVYYNSKKVENTIIWCEKTLESLHT